MRDHHNIPGVQVQATAILHPDRGAPFGQEVINHDMFRVRAEVAGQPLRGGCINTPWGREFAVVEQRSLQLDHLQHFRGHPLNFSTLAPANLSGFWIKSSYGNRTVSKKNGLADKSSSAFLFIVGLHGSAAEDRKAS